MTSRIIAYRPKMDKVFSRVPFAAWPAALFLLVLFVYPLVRVLLLSVSEPGLGTENFSQVFSSRVSWIVFRNTIEIASTVSVLCLLLGYPVAYFLVSASQRIASLCLIIVMISFFASVLVRTYAWVFLLGDRGVINLALLYLGAIDEPIPLLYNRTGVLIGMTHVMLPYMVLILFGVMKGIDQRLVQAAQSLGSSPFAAFRRVFYPLSNVGVFTGLIFVLVMSLAFYITPAMLGGPRETMIANMIANEVGLIRWGRASALAVILLVSTMLVLFGLQKFFGGLSIITSGPEQARPIVVKPREGGIARFMDLIFQPIWPLFPYTIGILVLAFLLLPILVMIPLSFNEPAYFVFPPQEFSLKWYKLLINSLDWREAAWNSLIIALMTTVFTMALSIPAAFAVSRSTPKIAFMIYSLLVAPLIIPGIITAIAVYFLMSDLHLVGSFLGVALGHTIGAMPLATMVLVASLRDFDRTLERASLSLGVSPMRTVFKVTLPSIKIAVVTASFFAFLHSFDELLVALFVSGIGARTLPKKMWDSLQEIDPTIAAVSSILILMTFVILVVVNLAQSASARTSRRPSK